MKNIFLGLAITAMLATACNNDQKEHDGNDVTYDADEETTTLPKPEVKEGEYVNLMSGEKVNIVRDSLTGIAIDSKTQIPVEFYYDPVTLDTMYQSGMIVNNLLIREGKGKYKLDSLKIKIDGDKIKIKGDSSKLKIDGDEIKMKSGDGKMKVDGKEGKIKTDDSKIKVDDGEMKVKPRN